MLGNFTLRHHVVLRNIRLVQPITAAGTLRYLFSLFGLEKPS